MSFSKRPGAPGLPEEDDVERPDRKQFLQILYFQVSMRQLSPVCIVFLLLCCVLRTPRCRRTEFYAKQQGHTTEQKAAQRACKQNLDNRRTGKWQRETAQGRKKYGKKSALRASAKDARTTDDANRQNKTKSAVQTERAGRRQKSGTKNRPEES